MTIEPRDALPPLACATCGVRLTVGTAFVLGGACRCTRCALRFAPLLRRSARTSLVVGSLLVAINQGPTLLAGHVTAAQLWQIPLTYAVPFCVATWGALGATRC